MTWRISPAVIFLALLGIFVLCYASTLRAAYGFMDDYAILAGVIRGQPAVDIAIAGGRPTYALLLRLSFAPLQGIADLWYLRFFGVLGIAVLALSLYRALVQRGWPVLPSFLFVVIIGTLPSFQVYAAWATVSFYPCAMLVAGGGVWLVERGCAERTRQRQWLYAIAATGCVALAMTLHQSSAMFFWVFAAITLLHPHTTGPFLLRRMAWYSGVMVVGLALGFVIYKMGIMTYGAEFVGPQRSALVKDLGGKLQWFVQQPLPNAMNGLNLFPTREITIGVAIWIVSGFMFALRGSSKDRLLKSVIALLLIPCTYLPNLLVAENWASYRTLGPLTSLVMLYVFIALTGYEQVLRRFVAIPLCTIVLGMAAVISTVQAARQVSNYFVVPQHQELEFMRSRLARADWSHTRSLYFVGLNDLIKSLGSRLPLRYDEFGSSSLAPIWSLRTMPYLLLRTLAPEHSEMQIELASPDGKTNPPPDALVIDLRESSSFVVSE